MTPSPSPSASPSPSPTPTPSPAPTPIFYNGFDNSTTLAEWNLANTTQNGGSLTVINTDHNTAPNSLDSILYSINDTRNFYDIYTIFPTSYQALYFSQWVKSINFVNSNISGGWNTAVAIGGFECGTNAGYASAEIVAVTLPNGSYWGIMYPIEPFRTWQYVVSNVSIVDGQWIHFVLFFDAGTGTNGNATLWTPNNQGNMIVIASAYGFNSSVDYQSTGIWAGQYVANGQNTGATTEFHMDTIIASTIFPKDPPF